LSILSYIGSQVEREGVKNADGADVLPFFGPDHIREFGPVFGFLNDKDRDILFLIFFSRKKQKEVQAILKRSQPSLCYDIKRIRHRLKFIFYIFSVFDTFVNFIESGSEHFSKEELEILTLMFYTSSFTVTASVMGKTQVTTRYAFTRCLARMRELEMWDLFEIFMTVKENLNSIRRTYGDRGMGVN
jgi:hypothetical protein